MPDDFHLLFSALDAAGTVQLWTTDGTALGTSELTQVENEWLGLYPELITAYAPDSGLVGAAFRGIDADGQTSLWTTDGTGPGTAELLPANRFTNGLDPKALTAFGPNIIFTGTDADGQTGIWTTDGSNAGTYELMAIPGVGAAVADPQSAVRGSIAYFAVAGRLVASDGTPEGTSLVAENLATADGGPSIAATVAGLVFAAAGQLWITGGTPGSTVKLTAIAAAHTTLSPHDIVAFGQGALFAGTDAAGRAQLWTTDGTPAGTSALTHFTDGPYVSFPLGITALGDRAIFFANDSAGHLQLWSTDGTTSGTIQLSAEQDTTGTGVLPTSIVVIGDHAVFTSVLGGVWTTDGTPAGTSHAGGATLFPSVIPALGIPGLGGAIAATGGLHGGIVLLNAAGGSSELIQVAYAGQLALIRTAALHFTNDAAPPCFLPGTCLLTARGQIAVEHLEPGDRVWTAAGTWQPLCWIGRGRAYIGPEEDHPARPVIIRAGALGDGVPARDLAVTQGHSLLFPDGSGPGALIPAVLLVNGSSIVLDLRAGEVDYYHVALAGHGVVLAEGAACETWRDDGAPLPFDTAPPEGVGGGPPYAPKHGYGPVAIAIWRALRRRAGCADPSEDNNPGLHLLADGATIAPDFTRDGLYRFTLRRRPLDLRIASRSAIPATSGLGPDIRRLGIGLREITIAQHGHTRRLGPEDPAFANGFHNADPAEGLRWTRGTATLDPRHLRLARGPLRLQIEAIGLAAYPP